MPALQTTSPRHSLDEKPSSKTETPLFHDQKNVVRWRPVSCFAVCCEIHSRETALLNSARLLFVSSHSDNADIFPDCEILRWNIERLSPAETASSLKNSTFCWRVENLNTVEIRDFPDENRALTFIEYSIVQHLVEIVKSDNSIEIGISPLFAMHGALLRKNDFGLMIIGASESGKSTLSCALWQNGWDLLSDDFSFIQNEQAFPAARRVSLREGSRTLLGEEIWAQIQDSPSSMPNSEGVLFHPHEVKPNENSREIPVELDAIIFLGRPNSAAENDANIVALQRCNPARAAVSLLPYCTLLARPEENEASNRVLDWGAALPRIAPLASRVAIYNLNRGALPEMITAIESLIASASDDLKS